MNKIAIIVKREYITRVRKRAFIIMTLIGPILFAAFLIIPAWLATLEDKEEKILFGLDDDIKDLNVNEHIELIPVTEANEEGEKRYVLDDFMMSETATKSKTIEIEPEIEEIVFERKTVDATPVEKATEEIDPMNSPISDLLKERADERRRKMKEFNYKFSSAKIDEIEKEPAYKRQGVNLEDNKPSSDLNASRMSVGTDDNNDVQLRSNNSFLHDNVD